MSAIDRITPVPMTEREPPTTGRTPDDEFVLHARQERDPDTAHREIAELRVEAGLD